MDIVSDPSLQRGAGGAGRDHPTARQRACRRRRSRPRPGYCRDCQCRVRCAWRARSQSADHARQPDRGDGIELMTVLHILSGGAAQGLVASLAPKFKAMTGLDIGGELGAVGGMAERLGRGKAGEIVVLRAAMIGTLGEEKVVVRALILGIGVVES